MEGQIYPSTPKKEKEDNQVEGWGKCVSPSPILGGVFNANSILTYFEIFNSPPILFYSAGLLPFRRPPTIN